MGKFPQNLQLIN